MRRHDERHRLLPALNSRRHEDNVFFASVRLSVSGISQTVIDEVS